MYCNACGKAIAEDARFCSYCGTVLGQMPAPKKLFRSRTERTVAGVCAGVAHYLDLDISLVRVIWVVVTILSGIFPGIVVYGLAWIIIPEEPMALPAVAAGTPVENR